eukprot:2086767-Prymnesium_polylepis.1
MGHGSAGMVSMPPTPLHCCPTCGRGGLPHVSVLLSPLQWHACLGEGAGVPRSAAMSAASAQLAGG